MYLCVGPDGSLYYLNRAEWVNDSKGRTIAVNDFPEPRNTVLGRGVTPYEELLLFPGETKRSELLTNEGETPIQIVRGTENPGAMPVIDRISLENALVQLPPGYRTVFVLHDIEGYEHYEVAEMLGIAEGTSKSQLHKARLKLRQLIRQQAASK